jgi:hypothetical protein
VEVLHFSTSGLLPVQGKYILCVAHLMMAKKEPKRVVDDN